MNSDQILDSASLASRPNCYFLGPFARRVSFASQQFRAYALVAALYETGRLRNAKRLAVVGAGVAGLTSAVALAAKGFEVDLFEADSDVLHRQAEADHRYVHPTIATWPRAGGLEETTCFPFLDWYADNAKSIVAQLRKQWHEQILPMFADLIHPKMDTTVQKIVAGPKNVFLRLSKKDSGRTPYDLAIITAGFSDEEKVEHSASGSYWEPDTLEDLPRPLNHGVIVSGSGDGGLIDALRIVCGFRPRRPPITK